jgi:hypothetical protein
MEISNLEKRIEHLSKMSDTNVNKTFNLTLEGFEEAYRQKDYEVLSTYCNFITEISYEAERRTLLSKYNIQK